jgi:hypothetical protein
MSVLLRALCLQRAFKYPSKGFKFPYPSKGFFPLSFKGRKKSNFDPFDLPLSFKGIPYPSKGEKSAILTLLTFPYLSKGSLILQREKKVQF